VTEAKRWETALAYANDRLQQLATIDTLTGLRRGSVRGQAWRSQQCPSRDRRLVRVDAPSTAAPVGVLDEETVLAFSFGDMLRYSGPGSPAGVALGYQAMRFALPLLDPDGLLQRREITVHTPFRGPGARDAFELVTRALTEGRYVVDAGLERPERGGTLEAFVFRLVYRQRAVTLLVQEGVVTDEFVSLARKDPRSDQDERHFTELKAGLAEQLVASSPADVFSLDA